MKYFCAILFMMMISCDQKTNIKKDIDKDLTRFSKLKETQLTKISFTKIIDLDTIDSNEQSITLKITNIGKIDLNPLVVRYHCPCISPPNYDSILKPNETREIKLNFPIDKKGNFSYPIWIYGNFHPYIKTVYVEGYRK